MDRVVHFEMPYEDPERLSKFYRAVFDWQMQMQSGDMGGYVLATTTASDERGPKTPGAINGGFFAKSPEWPSLPSVVVEVASIEASAKKVTDAGGQVFDEPIDIPGIGRYLAISDTEGNRVGMLEPISRA